MPSYFNEGAEQVKVADHRVEKLLAININIYGGV